MYAQLKVLVYHTTPLPPHPPKLSTKRPGTFSWLPHGAVVGVDSVTRCSSSNSCSCTVLFENIPPRFKDSQKTKKKKKEKKHTETKVREETVPSLCSRFASWPHASTAGVQFVRVCCGFSLHELTLNSRCQQRAFNQAKPSLTCHQLHCQLNTALSKKIDLHMYTHTMYTFSSLCAFCYYSRWFAALLAKLENDRPTLIS